MADNINIGDVVMCAFPFDDNPKIRKIRPAVVMEINAGGLVVLLLKITSKPPRNRFDYKLANWSSAGLHKESTVRNDKEELVLRSDVSKQIGSLTEKDFEMVKFLYNESYKMLKN